MQRNGDTALFFVLLSLACPLLYRPSVEL